MNGNKPLPAHIKINKLITLSKLNKAEVELDQTRGICVQSHIAKILTKAIAAKAEQLGSQLFKVPDY